MAASGVYQFLVVVLLFCLTSVEALDNGLALTPPMGWNSWLRYGCVKNCDAYPNECISENLIKRTADLMVSGGYLAAGYQYIVIDDCWQVDDYGAEPAADPSRFPSGIKALADYVHNKGLKFGIHARSYHKSKLFASWDIDFLKVGGNYNAFKARNQDFDTYSRLPNPSNHSILYNCWWPLEDEFHHKQPNYPAAIEHCNSWRNYLDNENNWSSTTSIMSWYADNQDRIAQYAGPGHWNDPDMLSVGNGGLTENQAQVEMAIWSILSAPLIMSVDFATIKPEYKKILLNSEVISVNQDKLAQQGLRVWRNEPSQLEVWTRKLSEGCYAVALVNLGDDIATYTFTHEDMKLPQLKYVVKDLYDTEKKETLLVENENLTAEIPATGVKFYKFIPY